MNITTQREVRFIDPPLVRAILLLVITSVAYYFDLLTRKIPNFLILAGYYSALLYQLYANAAAGILQFLAGSLLPILIFAPLFLIRALGAGDVKLLSVIGGFLGLPVLFHFLLLFLVLAGLLSLYLMLHRKILLKRFRFFGSYLKNCFLGKQIFPYGRRESLTEKFCLSVPILMTTVLFCGGTL